MAYRGNPALPADTQRRIAAIAQVHRRLYTGDSVNKVDMAEYLASLLEEIGDTWSTPEGPRALTLSAEPIELGTDKAVAVGVTDARLGQAIVVMAAGDAGGETALRARLRTTLPSFMQPGHYLWREELSRNANGKLDRSAIATEVRHWSQGNEEHVR